jgi:signal transduction histidine kinase
MHLRREQGPLRFRSVVSGKERLGHVLRLPGTGWGVVASADMGSRFISLRNRYRILSWLIAFAMLTALGILVLTSRRLVRPVLQIREALRRDDRPEHAPLGVPESGRRIAEYDELIEALDSLAERIATTEQQLIQAERASLLGQMASGIAHEVGTPLNVITGNAQYLMRKLPEDNATYATLQMIVKQADRIAEMVRRLLGFSHPMKAELMPVDLHELVVQTLDMIGGFTSRLQIQIDHDPDTPRVLGDPKLLEHVLLNLMMNACQAMPDGGRLSMVIGIGSEVGGDMGHDDSWVCFRIADTGVGIAPQHVPRIFEPFFTTKAQGQGTGLGLAIVERIVKQHVGQIDVSSRLGAGTVFTIRLRPCERAHEGE